MAINNYKRFLNLSKILNSTFGDEGPKNKALSSIGIKFDLIDDVYMKCRIMMIVNFGANSLIQEMLPRHRAEAEAMLQAALVKIKEEYEEKFPDSPKIKLTALEHTSNDGVEALSYDVYGRIRTSYFRWGCAIEVDEA